MLNTENKKTKLVFIHGNGFTPESYSSLLNNLKNNSEILPFLLRPLWDNEKNYFQLKNWGLFYTDFQNYLNKNFRKKEVIGIGHSIGGNIVLNTALRQQDLFKCIVLLDPTIFTPKMIAVWKFANIFNLTQYLHPLSRKTKKKKMSYDSFNEIYTSYRSKSIFSNICDNNLKAFIRSVSNETDGKINIIYPKLWEYQIYNKGLLLDNYIWKNISNLSIPCLIIRASKSNAFLDNAANKILKLNPNIKIVTLPNSTHLYPLEYPKKTYELIFKYLSNQFS